MPTLNKKEIEAEFRKIISKEMEGILVMDSRERFDMCEKILNENGKVISFIHSTRTQDLNEIIEWVNGQKREETAFSKFHIIAVNQALADVVAHLTSLKEKI